MTAAFCTQSLSAENSSTQKSGNDRFSIKAQAYMGGYVSASSNIRDIDPSAPTGLNIGIEFPSSRQRPWQQYLNDPTVGLGVSYLDFGDGIMGKGIAMYPYIMLNGFRSEHFHLKVKLAAGLAAVNETYYTTADEIYRNKTFGSHVNAYLSGGLNLEFPITRNLCINGEFGFYHISNGRTVEPNKGANVLYGGIGLVATLNPEEDDERQPVQFPDMPYRWSINVTASGGAHAADQSDGRKFLISTLHVGGIFSTCNWHGIGVGVDAFYNDAIGNPETNRGMYRKTENPADRLRVGLALNNEFKFGDVTALVDWGIYVINPVRNLYANDNPIYGYGPRPLFYRSDGAGTEEAFHYIRFGLRYRIYDNLYVQALAKTHMHICEFIEFGVGYQIPFLKKGGRTEGRRIFRHSRDWWQN